MVAAGLDYWEGETPGPFTGVSEAERLEAVTLAIDLGNDVNAHADFGDYRMDGDVEYTLLYYPHNIDELLTLGVGDPRWSGSTPLIGAIMSGQTVDRAVPARPRGAARCEDQARMDAAAGGRRGVLLQREEGVSGGGGAPAQGTGRRRPVATEQRP